MDERQKTVDKLLLELRRGTVVLSVLSQLSAPKYGYSLVQSLEEKGMPIEAGTLYPLLRRLERQGLLQSEWETSGPKPRKYYVLSDEGREIRKKLCQQWRQMVISMETMLRDGGENSG